MSRIYCYSDSVTARLKSRGKINSAHPMNKADLVEQVSRKANVTRVLVEKVLTATILTVIEVAQSLEVTSRACGRPGSPAVADGDRVALVGFGSFDQRTRNARTGRNPQTGEEIQIPPQTVPVFTALQQFKQAVVAGEIDGAA